MRGWNQTDFTSLFERRFLRMVRGIEVHAELGEEELDPEPFPDLWRSHRDRPHRGVRDGRAGVEMARSLPVPFTFVARAENLIRGRNDLDDTIRRLQAFERLAPTCSTRPGCATSPP